MSEKAFSNNPFMIGYDNRLFEGDEELGFRFPEGKLITRDRFEHLSECLDRIRRNTGYPVILNLGDSSTSGWNGNRVYRGNQDPNAPFFSYRTYSDLMLEDPNYPNVINVGVPGYSSFQGLKYLARLLRFFSREEIKVDYVTIYFGNNDSTYNKHEDKVLIDFKEESTDNRGERVTVGDFSKNVAAIIETAGEYGARPIVIVPPINYLWEPGIRSTRYREEFETALKALVNTVLREELESARKLFQQGRYAKACEVDRMLPRIKKRYRDLLIRTAKKARTPMIDIQIPLGEEFDYFVDYCHPNERANMMIVEEFKKIRSSDLFTKKTRSILKRSRDEINIPLPTDTYTLW